MFKPYPGRFSSKVGSIFDEATAALRRCRRDVCHRNEFVATSRCSRLLTLIELILGTTLANPKLSPPEGSFSWWPRHNRYGKAN